MVSGNTWGCELVVSPAGMGNGVPQTLHYNTRVWLNLCLVCYLGKAEEVRLAWPLSFNGVLGHQVTANKLCHIF